MKDYSLYEKPDLPDSNFPIRVFSSTIGMDKIFVKSHWHEQIELLYFIEGEAIVECSSIQMHVESGDLIVVNSNELHFAQNLSKDMTYHCIILDSSLFQSSFFDTCENKYISPITQNLIIFKNKVSNDKQVIKCIDDIVCEYNNSQIGFELAIKASIFRLLVLLLRNHLERIMTLKEYDVRSKNLLRLNKVLQYIEENYRKPITIEHLSKMSSVSTFHFCHLFKKATGKVLSEYINTVRLKKAEELLKYSEMNISEIAFVTGFNDANYFSRLFKKYKKTSPSEYKSSFIPFEKKEP